MRRRAEVALAAARRGRISPSYDLATFFIRACATGQIVPSDDDAAMLQQLIEYLQTEVVANERFALSVDYRSDLRSDARLITINVRPPIGALALYATWLEHWANGLVIFFGPRAGVEAAVIRRFVRNTGLEAKLTAAPAMVHLPPLRDELRTNLAAIVRYRNHFVHFKWEGDLAFVASHSEERIHALARSADSWLEEVHQHTLSHLYEPAVSIAERMFGFDREDFNIPFG